MHRGFFGRDPTRCNPVANIDELRQQRRKGGVDRQRTGGFGLDVGIAVRRKCRLRQGEMLVSGDEHGVDGDAECIEPMGERQMRRAGFVNVGGALTDTRFEPGA